MSVHGRGDRATAPWFPTHLGTRACRLVVRDSPAHAVEVAAGHLLAQGFVPGDPDLVTALRQACPAWFVTVLQIGSNARSEVRGIIAEMIPGFRPGIPLTDVVVCATQAGGATVVSVAPWMRTRFWGTNEPGSQPRTEAAVHATIAAYQQVGGLVEVGPWTMYEKDRTCPGNPAVLKAVRAGKPLPRV